MATDGTPEFAAKRCGEAIARLRTLRGWSRAQLIIRLYNELPPEDPNYESISETWLARLENGRMVKVQRQTVEALCRALRCSPQERAWVLLYADRNVLVDAENAPTPAAEALTFVMDRLYAEAGDLLTAMVGQQPGIAQDELSLLEATAAALEYLIEHHRSAPEAASGYAAATPMYALRRTRT
ncbi:MAG TPA: helix-turn-helix transcriptional regulator [Ktedonobacterales bacterium]|nr:helix-turn-helix transcriptional regulator [Ktedonobacterales bacterium]